VVHDFAAAGRVADMHRTLEVEMCGQRGEVVGVMIHVVATADLGGTSMATPVVGDDAIAALEEEQHLRVPIIGRQRPAMAEHDGLTFAPVLIIDVDVGSVFFSDRDVRHMCFPFSNYLFLAALYLR